MIRLGLLALTFSALQFSSFSVAQEERFEQSAAAFDFTFFTSSSERSKLDMLRARMNSGERIEPIETSEKTPKALSFNGYITSSKGRSIVFTNDSVNERADAGGFVNAFGEGRLGQQGDLEINADRQKVIRLKAGDTYSVEGSDSQ